MESSSISCARLCTHTHTRSHQVKRPQNYLPFLLFSFILRELHCAQQSGSGMLSGQGSWGSTRTCHCLQHPAAARCQGRAALPADPDAQSEPPAGFALTSSALTAPERQERVRRGGLHHRTHGTLLAAQSWHCLSSSPAGKQPRARCANPDHLCKCRTLSGMQSQRSGNPRWARSSKVIRSIPHFYTNLTPSGPHGPHTLLLHFCFTASLTGAEGNLLSQHSRVCALPSQRVFFFLLLLNLS